MQAPLPRAKEEDGQQDAEEGVGLACREAPVGIQLCRGAQRSGGAPRRHCESKLLRHAPAGLVRLVAGLCLARPRSRQALLLGGSAGSLFSAGLQAESTTRAIYRTREARPPEARPADP